MTDPGAASDLAVAPLDACPHLVSVDGPWHASSPSRAHRCRLLAEGRPTLDRQRDLCLVAAHVECPTWLEAHGPAGPPARPGPFVATAPVVLEGPGIGMPTERQARRLAGPVTIVVVGVALGALLLSRGPLTPGTSNAGGDGPTPSPAASAVSSPPPSAAPTIAPSAAPATPPPATPAPAATPRARSYTVRVGDTLSAIAVKFGTTTKALAALNKITNPSLIRPGQVLKLP